jgi:hypothetical protein
MAYIGNPLSANFVSIPRQSITGNGGASYTLTNSVTNENELEVFVNNVRQEPGVAYTASGTTLTMTGNVQSTDSFYVVYQGRALATVEPPANSVGSAEIIDDAVTSDKLAHDLTVQTSLSVPTIKDSSGSVTAMTIDSAGRVSRPVIPFAFVGFPGTDSYVAKTANAIVDFSHAFVNDGNHYNTSTYKFTCPVAGLYRVEIATLSELDSQTAAWIFHRETNGVSTSVGRIYTRYRALAGSMTIKCSANDKLYLTQNNNIDYYQTTSVPYNWATYTFIG